MTSKNQTKSTASDFLAQPYARRLTPDESGGYVATIQEFPGCIAEGDSAPEALRNLEAAAESWIEAQLGLGQPIPEPVRLYGFSGKLALRIPRGLHKRVAELASSEGVSINQLLVTAVSSYVSAKGTINLVADELCKPLTALGIEHARRLTLPVSLQSFETLSNLGQVDRRGGGEIFSIVEKRVSTGTSNARN